MPEKPQTIVAPALVLPPVDTALDTKDNKASTTTVEQDLISAGQRVINKVWEFCQALIALSVVGTTCSGIVMGRTFPPEWWTIQGLVIGFYFGRTNHARAGDSPSK